MYPDQTKAEEKSTSFVLRNAKPKSLEVQRLIKSISHSVRKHGLTQPTLRYIYRTVIKETGLTVPQKTKKLYRLPTTDELDAFFAVIKDPQEKLMFQLMLSTGARCSEITGILCDNIDFSANTVLICGKGSKERLLLLTPKMSERIKYFLAGREKNRKHLFLNRLYKPYTLRRVEQLCQQFKRDAGIDAKWTPHGLRHYTLSHLTGQNTDISLVKLVAGRLKYLEIMKERRRSLVSKGQICKSNELDLVLHHAVTLLIDDYSFKIIKSGIFE